MKKIFIIGANGQIGKILTRKLVETEDFKPHAMIRKEEQKSYFEGIGVETTLLNLEDDPQIIAEAISGFDAVVFTAGSGGNTGLDKTLEIDLDGAVKCMEAAENENISRFIIISASGTDDRNHWNSSNIKPYYIAKHYADRILKSKKLNYTILRPGRLTNDEGSGLIESPNTLPQSREIPREDVATAIVETLRNSKTFGKIIPLHKGNISISAALQEV